MNSALKNKVIVITRSKERSENQVKRLEDFGAVVIPLPTIKIVPVKNYKDFDRAARQLHNFDFIIFTSVNAVEFSLNRLNFLKLTIPENIQVAAVGKKTAEYCKERNIRVDVVPENFSAAGLIDYFSNQKIDGEKYFIPSSAIARKELKDGLTKLDGEVTKISVYKVTVPSHDELKPALDLMIKRTPDMFVFTSPSTFNNYLKIFRINDVKKYFENFDLAAIGPTTERALIEKGLKVNVVPENYTMNDLADTIIKFYNSKKSVNF